MGCGAALHYDRPQRALSLFIAAPEECLYLHFENALFNPLQLRLKLDKKAPQPAIAVRPNIGG